MLRLRLFLLFSGWMYVTFSIPARPGDFIQVDSPCQPYGRIGFVASRSAISHIQTNILMITGLKIYVACRDLNRIGNIGHSACDVSIWQGNTPSSCINIAIHGFCLVTDSNIWTCIDLPESIGVILNTVCLGIVGKFVFIYCQTEACVKSSATSQLHSIRSVDTLFQSDSVFFRISSTLALKPLALSAVCDSLPLSSSPAEFFVDDRLSPTVLVLSYWKCPLTSMPPEDCISN